MKKILVWLGLFLSVAGIATVLYLYTPLWLFILFLCLVGLGLFGYGVYNLIEENKPR